MFHFQASAMRAVNMGDGGNFNNPFDQRQPEELRQPYVNGGVNGIAGTNHTGNIIHHRGISWPSSVSIKEIPPFLDIFSPCHA